MTSEPLARIECDPARLAAIIEAAALRSGTDDAHDVMFSRLYADRIETPASAPDATQASYCTGRASQFESMALFVDPPVDVMFDIDRSLGTLSWLGEGADSMTLTFEGDPDGGVVTRLVHEVPDATVVLPAETDWILGELSLALPDRFRDGQFLGADGQPVRREPAWTPPPSNASSGEPTSPTRAKAIRCGSATGPSASRPVAKVGR